MNLPLHCLPPMPDWGLNKKEPHIPTEKEMIALFSGSEKQNITYTSSLLVSLLRYFVIDDVVFYLKYPRKPEFKKQTMLLQQLCDEIERESTNTHSYETIQWLEDCHNEFKSQCRRDIQILSLSTSSALLKAHKANDKLRIGVINSLLVIDKIAQHGAYVSRMVAERSGIDCQEFKPSQIIVLIKALLVDMADKLDCDCEHSSDMSLALDILIKKYLEILKV